MNNSRAGARSCYSVIFAATLCVALLQNRSYAAQDESQKSPAPETQTSSRRVDKSQPDVTRDNYVLVPSKEALWLSQYDLVRRDELESLRKEVADSKKSPWVLGAPWIAFGIVGLAFVVAWFVLNWRERVLTWQKTTDPNTVLNLEDLKNQVSGLITNTTEIKSYVDATNKSIEDLWRNLAKVRLASGGEQIS